MSSFTLNPKTTVRTIAMVVPIRYAEIIGSNVPEHTHFTVGYSDTAITNPDEWWREFMAKRGATLEVNSCDYARVNIHYDGDEYTLSPGATIVAYSDMSVSIVTNGQVSVTSPDTYSVKR
jgi:hypothetical protein